MVLPAPLDRSRLKRRQEKGVEISSEMIKTTLASRCCSASYLSERTTSDRKQERLLLSQFRDNCSSCNCRPGEIARANGISFTERSLSYLHGVSRCGLGFISPGIRYANYRVLLRFNQSPLVAFTLPLISHKFPRQSYRGRFTERYCRRRRRRLLNEKERRAHVADISLSHLVAARPPKSSLYRGPVSRRGSLSFATCR